VRALTAPSLSGWRARLGAAAILIRVRAFRFAEAHRLFARYLFAERAPLPLGSSQSG
jgi:hypothetical protein